MKPTSLLSPFAAGLLILYSALGHGQSLPMFGVPMSGSASQSPVDAVLIGLELPVISTLPVLSDVPVLDGRGFPVLRGLDEGARLGMGAIAVGMDNPYLSGGAPSAGAADSPVVDLIVSGGPTFNFLALDALLSF